MRRPDGQIDVFLISNHVQEQNSQEGGGATTAANCTQVNEGPCRTEAAFLPTTSAPSHQARHVQQQHQQQYQQYNPNAVHAEPLDPLLVVRPSFVSCCRSE